MSIKNHSLSTRIIVVTVALFCLSCEGFLTLNSPSTALVSATVFESDLTATAALSSIYTKMSSGSGGLTSITYLGPLLADEALLFSTDQATREFALNNITPGNSLVSGFWGSSGYSLIYQANVVIEGLQSSDKISEATKRQLQGEALFIRAFIHFYLVNLFGDIPYVATTDYQKNTSASRIPVADIYSLIIADLTAAKSLLSEDYSFSYGERIKPTSWAASALLARVYLYHGEWALAETEATSVIGQSDLFQLTDLDEVFLMNSVESIWQLQPVIANRNTNEGSIFILTGQPKQSALQDDFADAFESGDLRKSQWVNSITANGNLYYYPYKYKVRAGADLSEYSMVLRLAEQFLVRAEARAQLDHLAESIADVDVIRLRAGLPLIQDTNPSISKEDLLLAIENERKFELFTEWGHRWLDLKRTGRCNAVLSTLKPGWQTTDVLLPIPSSELLVNTKLTQNPGY